MTTPVLGATIRLLHILPPADPGFVLFQQRDVDTDQVALRVAMTSALWSDFGEPGEVTVTVMPGDHLNED